VFDFLCIHPFRDGNGRVSRLITTLLLQSNGFEVARYVSLERSIEESKERYYRVLAECSRDWRPGRNEILPWWNYVLGIVRSAYKELETQIISTPTRPVKSDIVRRAVRGSLTPNSWEVSGQTLLGVS
jgi:Fic family protein